MGVLDIKIHGLENLIASMSHRLFVRSVCIAAIIEQRIQGDTSFGGKTLKQKNGIISSKRKG